MMKKNKKLVAAVSLASLLVLAPISTFADQTLDGKVEIKLDGQSDGDNGELELTLTNVIDLAGSYDIDGAHSASQTDIALEEDGKLEIVDTRASGGWELKVNIVQPKERGSGVDLGASNIKFNISEDKAHLTGVTTPDVLGTTGVTVLSSNQALNHTVNYVDVAATFSMGSALGSGNVSKGVYQSTIVYTLVATVA